MRDWFDQRHPREQRLVVALALLASFALVWWIAIAPALQTYRASGDAHAKLDDELAQMQAMAASAKQLKTLPKVSAAQAQMWLDASIKKLGKANMSTQGNRVQVSFASVTPEVLAAWLAEARSAAQLLAVQANWKRTAQATEVLWDGSLVFELPTK
jgi:general secretion pathway protein M